jgi:hypothetical protein
MATITITPGNSFTATETVTSTKLNDLGSPTAALTAASIGTADIADDAITPALIAGDAVTTPAILDANVTFAKLTDVIDSDTMTGASATTLATSESIKAYVDSLGLTTTLPSQSGGVSTEGEQGSINVGPLIIKYGTINSTGGVTSYSFTDAFPSAIIGVNTTVQERVGNASYTSGANTLTTAGFELQSYIGTSYGAVGRVFFVAYGF